MTKNLEIGETDESKHYMRAQNYDKTVLSLDNESKLEEIMDTLQ